MSARYDELTLASKKYDELTLSKFTDWVFFKTIKPDYKPGTKCKVRKAITVLEEWHGSELLVETISFDLLKQFELAVSGTDKEFYVQFLWQIMRTAAPGRFPEKIGHRAKNLSHASGPTYLLEAFYHQLFEPLALRSRRPNTKRLYRISLRMFADFVGRPPNLDDLTDDTLNRFAQARLDSGKAPRTVNRNLQDLMAIWRWAHRKGYVSALPDVQLEIEPKHTPVAWTRSELNKLFETAAGLEGDVAGLPASVWWTTLLLVFWDTGERASAVFELLWEDIDTEACWIRFPAQHRKGAAADNSRKIATDTRASLESLRRWQHTKDMFSTDGKVFPWVLSDKYVWRAYANILKAAGLPHGKDRKFHCIRKSVASHFEQAGGNATELLDHESRQTTKAYLDPRIVNRTEGIDLLFRPKGED